MMRSSEATAVVLQPADIDRIVDLERRSFIPPLQVTRATLEHRFALGHQMVGVEQEGQLIGMLSYSLGRFDPTDVGSFPSSLKEFCAQDTIDLPNAAYTYNLEVEPRFRGKYFYKLLAMHAAPRIRDANCEYVVGNLRAPSYAGCDPRWGQERVSHHPAFQQSIDNYLENDTFPSQQEFLEDPLLAFYHRITGCYFGWIMRDWAPEDTATGGHRIIAYQHVDRWCQTVFAPGEDAAGPINPT